MSHIVTERTRKSQLRRGGKHGQRKKAPFMDEAEELVE